MKTNKVRISKRARLFIVSIVLISSAMIYYTLGVSGEGDTAIINTPIKVHVQEAESISENQSFAYSGTIEESESMPLSFPVTGTVLKVLVSEGEFVKEGQLLVVLDDTTLKNVYEMSLATLKQAEDAYRRLKPMYEKGSLPEIKFVEIETGLQQAKSAAAVSKEKLDDCNLYAPIRGFIGKRSIEPGMNVIPGFTAIKIIKIDKIFAKVPVSESEISFIEKGQKVKISVSALGYKTFDGVVEEIGVVADPIAHTYKVKIGIPNPDNSIKPGMICDARIQTSKTFEGVIVPNQAVQVDEKGETFVFCVDEAQGKVKRIGVETGQLLNDGIEIKEGLKKGEKVVIAGQQKLVDGSKVIVAN